MRMKIAMEMMSTIQMIMKRLTWRKKSRKRRTNQMKMVGSLSRYVISMFPTNILFIWYIVLSKEFQFTLQLSLFHKAFNCNVIQINNPIQLFCNKLCRKNKGRITTVHTLSSLLLFILRLTYGNVIRSCHQGEGPDLSLISSTHTYIKI